MDSINHQKNHWLPSLPGRVAAWGIGRNGIRYGRSTISMAIFPIDSWLNPLIMGLTIGTSQMNDDIPWAIINHH